MQIQAPPLLTHQVILHCLLHRVRKDPQVVTEHKGMLAHKDPRDHKDLKAHKDPQVRRVLQAHKDLQVQLVQLVLQVQQVRMVRRVLRAQQVHRDQQVHKVKRELLYFPSLIKSQTI